MTITLERPGNVPGRIFMAHGRHSLWRHLLCRREGQWHGRDAESWEGGSTEVGVVKTEAYRAHNKTAIYGDSESGTVGDRT